MAERDAIGLRPASSADEALLLELYSQTRAAELAGVPWPPDQRDDFVRSQWRLRSISYHAAHPDDGYSIISAGGHDVGCLFVAQLEDRSIRVVDIALLDAWCGRGIGTDVLRPILHVADERCVAVSLHVDPQSRAVGFYERLGFVAAGDDPTYLLMVRTPKPVGRLS
jgi:GNAT superfamily N-acetyltransferase